MIALRQIGTIDPLAMRRAAARAWPKNSHGGGPGVPAYVVAEMAADYQRTGSLAKTAAKFDRTKQDLAYIFHARGLPVKSRGGPNRKPRLLILKAAA